MGFCNRRWDSCLRFITATRLYLNVYVRMRGRLTATRSSSIYQLPSFPNSSCLIFTCSLYHTTIKAIYLARIPFHNIFPLVDFLVVLAILLLRLFGSDLLRADIMSNRRHKETFKLIYYTKGATIKNIWRATPQEGVGILFLIN